MISPTPDRPPYALTIASSDSSGGAGVQADLKTMTRLGVYGGSVIVAVTAQNTRGVESTYPLPTAEVRSQFDAVTTDVTVDAVKLGMLATREVIETVEDLLAEYDGPVVLDPVMVATSGDRLLDADAVDAYIDLFERATLLTPNADETEALTGIWPDGPDAREQAAEQFFEWGATAVLFKGGHVDVDSDELRDVLLRPSDRTVFTAERVDTDRTHGSGCTVASAIAAGLAHGQPLERAVANGVSFAHGALAEPAAVGANGSVNHLVADGDAVDEFDRSDDL